MQTPISTRITVETAKRLEIYLAQSGKSKASVVEEALKAYLDKVLKKQVDD